VPPRWRAWAAEVAGTGLFVFGALSGAALVLSPASAVRELVPAQDTRLLIAGVLAGGCVALIAASPLGRLSGAHINPAVTLAFAIVGRIGLVDVAGYLAAQLAGAVAGAAGFSLLWGSTAGSVGGGVTHPSVGTGPALMIEALATGVLVAVVFSFVCRERLARFTPLVLWPLITVLVWKVAPQTGASLNPARSAGPAMVGGDLADLWLYFVAPVAGAVAVALAWRLLDARLQPRTAALCAVTPVSPVALHRSAAVAMAAIPRPRRT